MSLTIVTHFNASDEFDARESVLELKSCSQTNVFFGSKQISKSALFIRGRNTYRHLSSSPFHGILYVYRRKCHGEIPNLENQCGQ